MSQILPPKHLWNWIQDRDVTIRGSYTRSSELKSKSFDSLELLQLISLIFTHYERTQQKSLKTYTRRVIIFLLLEVNNTPIGKVPSLNAVQFMTKSELRS